MRVFDTKVQYYKYLTLREVAKHLFQDKLDGLYYDVPKLIIPGPKPQTRCCIYKERAIITERVRLALGGDTSSDSVIEVIDIACDECPSSGYTVTDLCRGCIAHRCKEVCKFGAITFDSNQKAMIDKTKCVNCGACSKACQFSAIINKTRPCEKACPVKAISMSDTGEAKIDYDKCITCGACVYQCPFGAIQDKSEITQVIDLLKGSFQNTKYKVYAVVAPSISSQFTYATMPQVVSGIKELGFHTVLEAALGADMVASKEAEEFMHKDIMTSSCCPSFVSYIHKFHPKMVEFISENNSPMVELAEVIKSYDPFAKVVFIGPCISKKKERQLPHAKASVDAVLTFEELQSLFDALELEISTLEGTPLNNASFYGRIFARSGGLSDALRQALKEKNLEKDCEIVVSSGIDECKVALLKAMRKDIKSTFIEGMACKGGCIGGPCCLTHGPKDLSEVDKYGKKALETSIESAISIFNKI